MTRLAWTVVFLLFDREAGRIRPSTATSIAVVALMVASHLWLSGPWLQQAGFPAAAYVPADAAPSSTPAANCRAEALLNATSREPSDGLG